MLIFLHVLKDEAKLTISLVLQCVKCREDFFNKRVMTTSKVKARSLLPMKSSLMEFNSSCPSVDIKEKVSVEAL